jgi:hypothetical protein
MRVLVSYNLVQALWLNRAGLVEYADQLWELMRSGQIQGYITQKGLDLIHFDLIYLLGEDKAEKEVSDIKEVVEVSPVDPSIIEQALSYNLRDFESEVELACAIRMHLDAIVTQHPQNFSGANFPIFSVTDLLRQKLENIIEKDITSFSNFTQHPQNFDWRNFLIGSDTELLYQSVEEAEKDTFSFLEFKNQLNLNFYQETPLQLCLFKTSEIEPNLSYRIRNSINKVLKVFKILKEEGCTGLVHKELAKKAKCSEKTLDSIILDLKNFNMVVSQGYKVLVPRYLLKYEDNQIADYIANFLKKFLVTKEIYKQIKPGKTTTRPPLQKLIANISSNGKPIDPKSSSDYTSRMLSWFFFTGLLENRGNGMIYRPIIKGKHKRKLRETAEIQQLNLFAEHERK